MNSIKTKGMIFSLCVILFAVLVLGVSSYLRFKVILRDEVDEAMVRVAKESADHLNNYIDQFVRPLVGLSEDENIISMDWNKQKAMITSQVNPAYLNIAVVDKEGIAHYTDGSILNLSDRKYIREAMTGKIAFSEVITSRKTGQPVIMVSVPIYKDQVVTGALIARLDVDFLQDYAYTRGYGENGKAYIVSDAGTFISRPKEEESTDNYNLYDIAESDDKYESFSEFVQQSMYDADGYGTYNFENRKIIMGYAAIEETNWRIFIGTDEAETMKSLNGLRKMIIGIMALTILITTTAASIFVRRFSDPIIELDDLFAQGAKGNLTIRFTPQTKDEIGRVGISFNRMMDKIKTLTQYDPLTALLNQYVLEKDIEKLVQDEDQAEFSLIMAAIDKFSFVNETYGYTTGDAVLYEVARRISSCAAGKYQVYRYKGDEFVVLCKEGNEEEVNAKAQNILSLLKESYQIDDKIITINISIGVFTWDDDTRAEDPIKAVTQAKNYAKYMGSNQLQRFEQHIYKKLMIMNELQADIINGIKEEQFFLVYQPLFYLGDESIAEVEALIRWNHPEKGLLYPDQFIDLAEQAGTIINIDQWVLETAFRQLQEWKEKNRRPIILSVNLSAKTFETKSFIPNLVEMVNRYQIDPSLLQLEITERMVIRNVEESIVKLRELRSMGIHVAIDDFGIGYSSLSYIVRLPIDSIKIDKSFVQNINSSKEAKTIVSTIINLCKTLKLRVIAEGIESRLELEYLKMNQCDIGQGYYFSKPVTITEIEQNHMAL